MLCLKLREGKKVSITFGDQVMVVQVNRVFYDGTIQLGFEGPREIEIDRMENQNNYNQEQEEL